MRITPAIAVVALLIVGSLASVAILGGPDPATGAPSPAKLVAVDGAEGRIWPYTSRFRSVEGRTLAINVVVVGDSDSVRRALADRTSANWSNVSGDATVTESTLRPARGAARYTYVSSGGDSDGRWVAASYQLSTGTYLGRRVHVRAYPGPDDNWTALQAHTEYWDWYRLRHTVTSADAGARFVERDLRDEPFVREVKRVYHGQTGGGSDGWLRVIELTSVVAAGAVVPAVGRRLDPADVALPVALVWLLLGVRAVGIAAEGAFPGVTPKLFVAVLYPALAAGPPLLAASLANERRPERAAVLAATGLGVGLVIDVGSVGVTAVPVRLVLHRTALVATLGWLTYGFAVDDRRVVYGGLVGWAALLAGTALGYV